MWTRIVLSAQKMVPSVPKMVPNVPEVCQVCQKCARSVPTMVPSAKNGAKCAIGLLKVCTIKVNFAK